MKTVYSNAELPHLWAHQTQESARGSSVRFEGHAFYSYFTVIGRILEAPGDVLAYVVDWARFSASTSKHQCFLNRAIPEGAPKFFVTLGERGQRLDFTPSTLRDYYVSQALKIRDGLPSRYAHKRAEQWQRFGLSLSEAKRVCGVFKLGSVRVDKLLAQYEEGKANADAILKEARERAEKRRELEKAEAEKKRLERLNEQVGRALASPEWPKSFFECECLERHAKDIPPEALRQLQARVDVFLADARKRWDAGESVPDFPCEPIRLRAVAAMMQTSKAASVPLADAERAFRFAMAVRRAGREWHKNGERCPVGSYQIDAIHAHGIVAGCHRISWAEVDRFAALMGWTAEVSASA